jgi:hypothetical protein
MHEQISPELALVDPDLAARARAALPTPDLDAPLAPLPPLPARAPAPAAVRADAGHRPYPIWARVTAALWLLVLGILIGGAAIPHAQDAPRVVPPSDDPTRFCEVPSGSRSPNTPSIPDVGSPLRPGTAVP